MDLNDDSRQWDYTDAAQRILIAERCRAMLDALASNTPKWDDATPDATRENLALEFANLTNAKGSVESALRRMRAPASPEPAPTFRRGIYIGEQNETTAREIEHQVVASTATALHSCSACGRHPDTHMAASDPRMPEDYPTCPACGLGEVHP